MAVRVLLWRPTVPVPAIVSHIQQLSSPLEIGRVGRCAERSSSCSVSSSAGSSRFDSGDQCRTRDRTFLRIGGKSGEKLANCCSFGALLGLQVKTIYSSVASGSSEAQTLSVEEEEEGFKTQEQILNHQKAAPKLSHLDEARTVVASVVNGVLSTISVKNDGFPVGSMVPYAAEEAGSILLCISSLSPHTADLEANSKCSLLIPKDPTDRTDIVITVIGDASPVSQQDESAARSAFLKKHPGAFWVDFGDFRFIRIEPRRVRFLSGIATGLASVGNFLGEEFKAAKVDPISEFAAPIANHMNKDHADQTRMIVEHSVGIKVESAIIRDVDSLGFNVISQFQGKPLKLRVPFPRVAENRKDVKTLIVEMLSASTPKGN